MVAVVSALAVILSIGIPIEEGMFSTARTNARVVSQRRIRSR
jgi:hypothetical protein